MGKSRATALIGLAAAVVGAAWAVDAGQSTVAMAAEGAMGAMAPQLPAGLAPVVEPVAGLGEIDWTRGEAVAVGQAPIKASAGARARMIAMRLARIRAYRNAVALLAQVRVNADQTLGQLATKRREISIEGFVSGFQVEDRQSVTIGDKTYEQVRLRVPFYGVKGLSVYVYDCAAMRPLPVPLREQPWRRPAQDLAPELLPPIIVIDATGLGVEAAVYPKIQDNLGHALLSIDSRDPAVAVSEGMVTYVTPPELSPATQPLSRRWTPVAPFGLHACADQTHLVGLARVASAAGLSGELIRHALTAKPRRRRRITVKATGTAPGAKVNVVVSAADAKKLASNPKTAQALKSGKVYVVVDTRKAAIEGRGPGPDADARLAAVGRDAR